MMASHDEMETLDNLMAIYRMHHIFEKEIWGLIDNLSRKV